MIVLFVVCNCVLSCTYVGVWHGHNYCTWFIGARSLLYHSFCALESCFVGCKRVVLVVRFFWCS